ncbi:multidrug effflux MFS transporter [Citricoccus sp. GCM10030269]|uniref:multidrug effflux MFS transporter n=1 Tax=Citricoccus sp. GCM10030269 TaxID=3273388 RepID=UPI003619F8DC
MPEPSRGSYTVPTPEPAPRAPTTLLVGLLALLSAVAPLATDMYLPAFPDVATDLGTTASGVQLTLTAFMLGLAAGQLVIGPLSDSTGRRGPLLAGTVLCLAASVVCALAPDITVLTIARFLQGFTGAAGIVLARAIITDTTRGPSTAKLMSLMMVIGGIMPVLAPLAGGVVLEFLDWRGIFWVVAALVAVMILGVATVVRETLPPAQRHAGGLRNLLANAGTVLRHRGYVTATLVFAMSFGALFSYISASPFVLQNVVGLTPLQYSIVFGVNSLGLMGSGALSIRLVSTLPVRRVLGGGLTLLLLATVGLFTTVLLGTALVPVLICMFALTFSLGFVLGNASALAMRSVPTAAGTGSAFMGAFQFLLGAAVAPLVGIGGEHNPMPMAAFALGCAALAGTSFLAIPRSPGDGDGARS